MHGCYRLLAQRGLAGVLDLELAVWKHRGVWLGASSAFRAEALFRDMLACLRS